MHSFTVILTALFALTAQALPTPQDVPAPQAMEHDHVVPKDASPIVCKITGDGVRYRACPSTDDADCPALGQYPIGTQVSFSCYTSEPDAPNKVYWDRTADGQYVYEDYVENECAASLPEC